MKKVIRLTENDLTRIVRRIIMEQGESPYNKNLPVLPKKRAHLELYNCLTNENNWVFPFKKVSGTLDGGGKKVIYSRKLFGGTVLQELHFNRSEIDDAIQCYSKMRLVRKDYNTFDDIAGGVYKELGYGVERLQYVWDNLLNYFEEFKDPKSFTFEYSKNDKPLMSCDQLVKKIEGDFKKFAKNLLY